LNSAKAILVALLLKKWGKALVSFWAI